MYYLYFIDNFGRANLDKESNSKEEISLLVKNEMGCLDPDTNRYIMITTHKIPTYQVKGINK